MVRKRGVRRSKTTDSAESTDAPKPVPEITPEECRTLATSYAFFKAEHYREASPESIRESDIESAERAIENTLKDCGKERG